MSDDAGTDSDTDSSANDADHPSRSEPFEPPRCPRCGTPIAQKTMIGPGEAIAGPCGCRVAPPDPDRTPNSDSDLGSDTDPAPDRSGPD
ncbi:hypothetical protein [Natrialba asiatica]|uniref:Small CPxCG-related zinc finger protein n=1 Tax=Natrialba asiatica (strain ATCC 700177 / DSM 12278 / JCM 9576 / FERM P-10747 / NBRC 102637 / 172P1) TaxID=29540 RepID=M0ASP2_NATA1|nr:hypothetical protein [Natrialba asiatica]ELZ00968.1 hypothetical protein C481_10735 [Natrialba asiatica DSM 12278]